MEEELYKYIKIKDLKDMLQKTGELYSNNIAYKIKTGENKYKTINHKQIREEINGLGTALIDLGLKNKRIAIIGENRYEWEVAYLAIVCGTGVVVPLDKSLPENELESLIERSEVEAIVYSKKYEHILEKIKIRGVGKLKKLISMDAEKHHDGIYSQKELIESGKKLMLRGNKKFLDAKIDNEKMNMMLFTSGTTSASKAVMLSHKNICSNLMALASVLDVNSDDIFLSFLPLHHVFECTVGFLFALYKGAQITFCDGMRYIVSNMNEYKVSVMASVPAIYERIYKILSKSGDIDKMPEKLGGKVKLLISGAASLEQSVEKKYRETGLNLVQGYGLTETSPIVAIGNEKYYKLGSIGKTLPNVEARLVNCDKEGVGELVVKGPNVMLGYYQNEQETKKVIKDDWFYTGDLAKIDDEGYIFICGRKKNVIVLKNGKNIFPEEMENLINRIEGVEESFVYGRQVTDDKENIKIFAKVVYNEEIVKNAYKIKTQQEIFDAINAKIKEINKTMPRYKAIRGIVISQTPLIKTATNKIKRPQNLELILKEEKECN